MPRPWGSYLAKTVSWRINVPNTWDIFTMPGLHSSMYCVVPLRTYLESILLHIETKSVRDLDSYLHVVSKRWCSLCLCYGGISRARHCGVMRLRVDRTRCTSLLPSNDQRFGPMMRCEPLSWSRLKLRSCEWHKQMTSLDATERPQRNSIWVVLTTVGSCSTACHETKAYTAHIYCLQQWR